MGVSSGRSLLVHVCFCAGKKSQCLSQGFLAHTLQPISFGCIVSLLERQELFLVATHFKQKTIDLVHKLFLLCLSQEQLLSGGMLGQQQLISGSVRFCVHCDMIYAFLEGTKTQCLTLQVWLQSRDVSRCSQISQEAQHGQPPVFFTY